MLKKIFVIFSFSIILMSCTTTKYYFNERLYDTPEAALQAAREFYSQNVSRITPTDNPLGGRALCVIPSRNLIEKKGIKIIIGDPVKLKPNNINFLVLITELSFEAHGEALQKRKIFDEVKIIKSENPASVTIPEYDVVIYLVLIGPEQMQWFLRSSLSKNPSPIYSDMSLPRGVPRTMSWLKNIE